MARPYRVGLALLLALGAGALYYGLDPARYPFPRCPFYLLTGLFCPGCGSQRATHALLHGHVGQAAGLNLLAVAALPLLAIGAVDGVWAGLTGVPRRAALLYRPWLGWLTVACTLAFAVLRNLPGALGTWLAP
ncbi:MAG: DUF2752 domain-containing protein [Hymenobacter sp.]|nr:MAG: DUF2752 domain-containing protein [Hymenobacter sp.]